MCLSSLRVSYFFRLEVEKSQETLHKRSKSCGSVMSIKQESTKSSNLPVISGLRHVAHEDFHNSAEIQMFVFKFTFNSEQQFNS